jgi:hypothetical protein
MRLKYPLIVSIAHHADEWHMALRAVPRANRQLVAIPRSGVVAARVVSAQAEQRHR